MGILQIAGYPRIDALPTPKVQRIVGQMTEIAVISGLAMAVSEAPKAASQKVGNFLQALISIGTVGIETIVHLWSPAAMGHDVGDSNPVRTTSQIAQICGMRTLGKYRMMRNIS